MRRLIGSLMEELDWVDSHLKWLLLSGSTQPIYNAFCLQSYIKNINNKYKNKAKNIYWEYAESWEKSNWN